jgi:hypothetical protein
VSKRRGMDSAPGEEDQVSVGQAACKASLEASDELKNKALPSDLPPCPKDNKFSHLLPYIHDYCKKVAEWRPQSEAGKPIRVPLPFDKKYVYEPKKVVNNGYSMVDSISMGKSAVVECYYEQKNGKEKITYDKSAIETHSLCMPILGKHKRPFHSEREVNSNPVILFENPAIKLPQWAREKIHADPRNIIVADPVKEANTVTQRFDAAEKAEKKK